jgi:thiol-disulfide isomerase/thioredoxin
MLRAEWEKMSDKVLIYVALSVIIVLMFGTTMRMGKPQAAPVVSIESVVKAEPARALPAVSVTYADGQTSPLANHFGRPTIITFWATWCMPCLREMPTVGRFKAQAEGTGIQVLTVSEDKEGGAPAKKFLAERGLSSLPLLVDADGSLAKSLGVKGMPTTLIINAQGEEVARVEGESDWSERAVLDVVTTLTAPPAPTR